MEPLRKERSTVVNIDGTDISIKHLTTKEYANFQASNEADKMTALKELVKVSLKLDDAGYDDMPMSLLRPLAKAILKVNGMDADTEEVEVKN